MWPRPLPIPDRSWHTIPVPVRVNRDRPYHSLGRNRSDYRILDLPSLVEVADGRGSPGSWKRAMERRQNQGQGQVMMETRPELVKLIAHKISICTIVFPNGGKVIKKSVDEHGNVVVEEEDVDDEFKEQRETKMQCLRELLDFFQMETQYMDACGEQLVEMVAANVFRPFRPFSYEIGEFDPEEDEPNSEPDWFSLQFVYDIFLHCLKNTSDFTRLMHSIDTKFLANFVLLFNSEDSRERERVKDCLHRIYAKSLKSRLFIRRSICYLLFQSIEEGYIYFFENCNHLESSFLVSLKFWKLWVV